MEKKITKDGSITYYNTIYKEAYHSYQGAYTEAMEKYVLPCLKQIQSLKELCILDIGTGLGYNLLATIDYLIKSNYKGNCVIVSIEKDPGLHKIRAEIELPGQLAKFRPLMKELIPGKPIVLENIEIQLLIGDAGELIKNFTKNQFNAVYLDPFSPKKNPELWEAGFINHIFEVMIPGGICATYSCARSVKDNFINAGFSISEGPKLGRRNGGVIGKKPIIYNNV